MEILVMSYAILAFMVVVVALSRYGADQDQLRKRIKFIDGKGKKQENIEELNDTFYNRFFAPTIGNITKFFDKINSAENRTGKKNETTKEVERQLRLAGIDMTAEGFLFYKNCFMLFVVAITALLVIMVNTEPLYRLMMAAFGGAIALLGPNMFLRMSAGSRQEAIRIQLPDALDLMGVCIEAGLSFDNSLLKVSEKFQGPFIDELMIVYREIQMGVPRNDALRKLSEGSEIPELKTFISALIQANQLGIPINNVMGVQSEQLRETRKQNAREKGAQAPVKMLIPMLLFIFPVIFIVLMAPTVLNIMEMF